MTKRGDTVADVIATVGVNYSSCQCLSRRAQPAAAPRGRRGSGVISSEGTAKLRVDAPKKLGGRKGLTAPSIGRPTAKGGA